jgi:hypothetical protein
VRGALTPTLSRERERELLGSTQRALTPTLFRERERELLRVVA